MAGMKCFNSSDPAALNATLLFDHNNDIGDLWSRKSLDPLPSCSSSSTPLASRCTVCVDQLVRVVCSNLTKGAKVAMEAGAHQVEISESGCPKLSSDDAPSDAPSDAPPQWLLPVVIASILLLLFIIIISGVCLYKYCKRFRSEGRSEERKSGQASEESSALTDVVTS